MFSSKDAVFAGQDGDVAWQFDNADELFRQSVCIRHE
jgi:hypothetical protein